MIPHKIRINGNETGEIQLRVRAASGQTATVLEVQNSAGTTLFSVDNDGDVTIAGNLDAVVNETLTGNITLTGNLVVNGNTTIGNASTDTFTINATPTFNTAISLTTALTSTTSITSATLAVTGSATVGMNLVVGGTISTQGLSVSGSISFGGAARFANGTAALPSIAWASDTDTGFYRSAANEISVASNGAQDFTFSADVFAALSGSFFRMADNTTIGFGNTISAPDAIIGWNTTQTVDGWYFGTADAQNTLIIAENGDRSFDFAVGAQTNPTVRIFSAAQNTTFWLGLSHNQTNAIIDSGAGGFILQNSSSNLMAVTTSPALILYGSASGYVNIQAGSTGAGMQFRSLQNSSTTASGFNFINDLTTTSFNAAAGTQKVFSIGGTQINQTVTAAYIGFEVAITETTLGSGTSYLFRLLAGAAGTTEKFSITNTGLTTISQAAVGAALNVNSSATTFTDSSGLLNVTRSGNLTLVDTQIVIDLSIEPGVITLIEPGAGTGYYYGLSIDLSTMLITAGAGTSQIAALRLIANSDADVGTNLALFVESGTSRFDGNIAFGSETIDIGTSTVGLNDLHFGSGGIINFDGGDITLTHSANTLAFAGGTNYTFDDRITTSGEIVFDGTTATTGAGAVALTGAIHEITTNGVGNALTLADGTEGQVLKVVYIAEGGGTDTAVLTPTNLAGTPTTITFAIIGDACTLLFTAGTWFVVGANGVVVA